METPDDKSEDMVRVVRAVLSSRTSVPTTGIFSTEKSINFAINFARNRENIPKPKPAIKARLKIKWLEKKFPIAIKARVEGGRVTPSSLNVPARVGTTKANIKTPITAMADNITPG